MVEPRSKFADPWPEDTRLGEVLEFASERSATFMLLFAAAARNKDNERMIEAVKAMRGVVTRVDQYRRMKARTWAANGAENSKQEKTHT